MKKIITIISLLLIYIFEPNLVYAKVHIITANSSPTEGFVPAVTNAVCGDTIKWVLGNGTHTTASTTIPVGAASWNSGNITTSGFIYVVTVAGSYNYTCHPATGGHMPGSIIVTCSTGLSQIQKLNYGLYPNPVSQTLFIQFENEIPFAEINVLNALGENVLKQYISTTNNVALNVAYLSNGVYFVQIKSNNNFLTNKFSKQ